MKAMDMDQVKELDQEWVELMVEAFKLGLTKEEIREFLSRSEEGIA